MNRKERARNALYNTASLILYVSQYRRDLASCPHGNCRTTTRNGWWCDECFEALRYALLDVAALEPMSGPFTEEGIRQAIADHCPCCGHLVRVVGEGETQHYEPLEAKPLAEWKTSVHVALDGSGFAFFDRPPKPVGMGRDYHCRVAIYEEEA